MTLSNDEIIEYLDSFDKESKAIKRSLYKLCWYMRGGISLTELLDLSADEREIIVNIVNENLEVTKETNLPFF